MERLSDDWKNVSISIATTRPSDIVHSIESTFPDVEVASKVYDLIYSFWSTDKGDKEKEAILNEDIFGFLNKIAPKGYYFGARPTDEKDFGFWEHVDCENCGRLECDGAGHSIPALALLHPEWPRYPNCFMSEK